MTAMRWWHWDRWPLLDQEIQVYDYSEKGLGWGIYDNVECPICKQVILCTAPVGSFGFECPYCGTCDPGLQWSGPMVK